MFISPSFTRMAQAGWESKFVNENAQENKKNTILEYNRQS
jgi:hypothetical protein